MKQIRGEWCWLVVGWVALSMLFFAAVPVSAQVSSTGTILGTVKDSTGAVVAGAMVTATDTDTNLVRTGSTAQDGSYRFPALPVGNYDVKVSLSGFETAEHSGLMLEVTQQLVVDFALTVGTTSQTVTVTGEAPLVDTTSSTVGSLVNEDRVSDLPLNGRNWTDLTLLQPGISQSFYVATGTITNGGMTGTMFSSNGATLWSNLFLLDGAIMQNLDGLNDSSIIGTALGVDGIKEYKVATNTFSAEYGMVMGSQSTIVSKGGTNQFHGDAFDYLRNSSLDSRNYFDALDVDDSQGCGTDKSPIFVCKRIPPYRRNQFGGALGGPIKKDKTFFWGVYEGLRSSQGATITTTTVPKACFVNGSGTLESQIPSTIMNTNTYGTCVSGGPSTINVVPVVQGLADLFPQPNVVAPTFDYTHPFLVPASENYGQMRIDQNFSDTDTLFARFTADYANETQAGPYQPIRDLFQSDSQFTTLSENHIFSPSLLNTFRFSVSRTNYDLNSETSPEITGPNVTLVAGQDEGNITLGSGVTGFSETLPSFSIQNIFQLSDDLFYTKGKHAFKFGTEINRYDDGIALYLDRTGTLSFSNLGDFFNGIWSALDTVPPSESDVNRYIQMYTIGFYAQDDYRVLPRLTLNLGLRYEFNTVPTSANATPLYSVRDPLTDAGGTEGPWYANPSLHNFAPRFGFAWDVFGNGKTAVRGGTGIFYDIGNSFGQMVTENANATPPLSAFLINTNASSTSNPAGCPLTLPLPTCSGQALSPRTVSYDLQQPTMAQWNLGVEQQLPWQTALTVAYVGSKGWHIGQIVEGNPTVPVGYEANGLPIFCNANSLGECPSVFPARTNPNLGETSFQTDGSNIYFDSLQVTLDKRVTHGLEAQFNYTWEKLLDDGEASTTVFSENIQYPENIDNINKGPVPYEVPQQVHVNLIYHAPTIGSNDLISKVANGWWFGAIVTAQTGYPLTPSLGINRELDNDIQTTSMPSLAASYNPATVVEGTPNQWFNPTMFALQPAGTLGNEARGLFLGPGIETVNFSIVKDTKASFLGEAGNIEFRAELFNALNHPNFGPPVTTVYTAASAGGSPAGQIGTTVDGVALTPYPTAGQISTTSTTSRQIQLALKVIF